MFRAGAGNEFDEDRCAFESESRAHLVLQKGEPVGAGAVGVVNEDLEVDRVGAGLRGVIDLETFSLRDRRGVFFDGLLDYPIQYAGGDFGAGLGGDIVDGLDAALNVVAAFGGNKKNRSKSHEGESLAKRGEIFGLGNFFFGVFGQIPFVH